MFNVDVKIDWIEFTILEGAENTDDLTHVLKSSLEMFQRQRAHNGYTHAVVSEATGARYEYSPRRLDMGVHWTIQGQGCQVLRMLDISPTWLVTELAARNVKLTRIDIALDVHDIPISTEKIYELLDTQSSGGRKPSIDRRLNQDGRGTLYVGSPKSVRRLRIYDKALEQNVPLHWHRWEVVLRNERARHAGAYLVATNGRTLGALVVQHLKEMISFNHPLWDALQTGELALKSVNVQPLERDAWIWINSVLKGLGRRVAAAQDTEEMLTAVFDSLCYQFKAVGVTDKEMVIAISRAFYGKAIE